MTGRNMTPMGARYGAHLTDTGVWVIKTQNVCCYLLIGSEKALLIDTAYGKGDLRQVVEHITPLPLIVVNTHTHHDHSGGNGFWEKVWAGSGSPRDGMSYHRLPHSSCQLCTLSDGQVFDLGGRSVEAVAIGAHHPSSFAFLDIKGKNLMVGDEIDAGQVLLNLRGDGKKSREIIQLHLANMQKLKAMEGKFDRLFPAHNGAPLSKDYIDDFIALSTGILQNSIRPCPAVAGYGFPPFMWGGNRKLIRYRWRRASFICAKQEDTK